MTMLLKLTIYRYLTFDFRFVEANECLADVKIKKSLNRGVGCYQISGLYNERNRTYTFIKDKKLNITKFVSTPFNLSFEIFKMLCTWNFSLG